MGTISRKWGGDGVACSSPCQSLVHSQSIEEFVTRTVIDGSSRI